MYATVCILLLSMIHSVLSISIYVFVDIVNISPVYLLNTTKLFRETYCGSSVIDIFSSVCLLSAGS